MQYIAILHRVITISHCNILVSVWWFNRFLKLTYGFDFWMKHHKRYSVDNRVKGWHKCDDDMISSAYYYTQRGHWWRRPQPTPSIITDKNRSIQTYTVLKCKDDVGSVVELTSSLVWADVILADFQGVISRFLQDISTYLSVTAQRVLRTTFMQKSNPNYACLPSKIVEVWFCVRCDWWRRLQPTSSVSLVCY